MRKPLIALVALMLISALLLGCQPQATPASATAPPTAKPTTAAADDKGGDDAVVDAENIYAGVDLSKEGTVITYWVGDIPADTPIVIEQLNKFLLEKVNSKIEVNFLSWADYTTKYSLMLAGGEPCDMIFTGDWCFYGVESAKGSFMEITYDWLERCMPQTLANHDPVAWEQIKVGGKMYAVPYGYEVFNETMMVVRDDLRTKYELPEITSVETLEDYLFTVAEKETDLLAYNASKTNGFNSIVLRKGNDWINFAPGYDAFVYKYTGENMRPSSDDVLFVYNTPEYREWAQRMRTWNEKGVFPKDALNNDIHPRDSFENGKNASLTWNLTVFKAGANLAKNNPDWVPGYYDIFPNAPKIADKYSNACNAIPVYCKDPDRVGVIMDLMFYDPDVHFTFLGGIEGVHYNWVEEYKVYEEAADASKYPWCAYPWSLQVAGEAQKAGRDPMEIEYAEVRWPASRVQPITAGFRVNDSAIKNEWAAVKALIDEYEPQFDLGQFEDIDAALEEFLASVDRAGLPVIEKAIKDQLDEYMAIMQ